MRENRELKKKNRKEKKGTGKKVKDIKPHREIEVLKRKLTVIIFLCLWWYSFLSISLCAELAYILSCCSCAESDISGIIHFV